MLGIMWIYLRWVTLASQRFLHLKQRALHLTTLHSHLPTNKQAHLSRLMIDQTQEYWSRSALDRRYTTAGAGLAAGLTEVAVRNANGNYLTSAQGDYEDLANNLGNLPSPTADWSTVNLTYICKCICLAPSLEFLELLNLQHMTVLHFNMHPWTELFLKLTVICFRTDVQYASKHAKQDCNRRYTFAKCLTNKYNITVFCKCLMMGCLDLVMADLLCVQELTGNLAYWCEAVVAAGSRSFPIAGFSYYLVNQALSQGKHIAWIELYYCMLVHNGKLCWP